MFTIGGYRLCNTTVQHHTAMDALAAMLKDTGLPEPLKDPATFAVTAGIGLLLVLVVLVSMGGCASLPAAPSPAPRQLPRRRRPSGRRSRAGTTAPRSIAVRQRPPSAGK